MIVCVEFSFSPCVEQLVCSKARDTFFGTLSKQESRIILLILGNMADCFLLAIGILCIQYYSQTGVPGVGRWFQIFTVVGYFRSFIIPVS